MELSGVELTVGEDNNMETWLKSLTVCKKNEEKINNEHKLTKIRKFLTKTLVLKQVKPDTMFAVME